MTYLYILIGFLLLLLSPFSLRGLLLAYVYLANIYHAAHFRLMTAFILAVMLDFYSDNAFMADSLSILLLYICTSLRQKMLLKRSILMRIVFLPLIMLAICAFLSTFGYYSVVSFAFSVRNIACTFVLSTIYILYYEMLNA